jgi:hypothetical protein
VGTKDGIQLMEQAKSMIRHNLLHDPALLSHPFFSSPGSPPPTTSAATKILTGKKKKNYSFGHTTTLHVVALSSRKNRSNSSNIKRC